MPPSRNLGVGNAVGNASCGDRHGGGDPLALIVSAGARKEKLRQREPHLFRPASRKRRPAYVELHAASAFSFLDGASLPEDLVEEAARLEIPAVALGDTNGVYGAPRFYKAAKAAGIKALVGAEVTLVDEGNAHPLTLPLSPRRGEGVTNAGAPSDPPRREPRRLQEPLPPDHGRRARQAQRRGVGHVGARRRARRRAARSHRRRAKGRSRAPSRAAGSTRRGRELEHLAALFPGRLHVELQRHRRRDEEHRNHALVDLARLCACRSSRRTACATRAPKDKELHDVLTASATTRRSTRAGRLLAAQRERHFKAAARDGRALRGPAGEPLDGRVELAARLDFTLADLGYRFPDYPLPPGETPSSLPAPDHLERRARALPAAHGEGAGADREGAGDHREARPRRLLPHRLGHRALLPARTASSCRGAARPPTAPSATRSRSPRSIR